MSSSLVKTENASIEKFDGGNFISWSVGMKALLQAQGHWAYVSGIKQRIVNLAAYRLAIGNNQAAQPAGTVDGTVDGQTEWEAADVKARGMIVLFTKPHIQMTLQSFEFSKEVWDDLVTKYGTPGSASLLTEFLHMQNIKIGD